MHLSASRRIRWCRLGHRNIHHTLALTWFSAATGSPSLAWTRTQTSVLGKASRGGWFFIRRRFAVGVVRTRPKEARGRRAAGTTCASRSGSKPFVNGLGYCVSRFVGRFSPPAVLDELAHPLCGVSECVTKTHRMLTLRNRLIEVI
jgi:hypothetical protein